MLHEPLALGELVFRDDAAVRRRHEMDAARRIREAAELQEDCVARGMEDVHERL